MYACADKPMKEVNFPCHVIDNQERLYENYQGNYDLIKLIHSDSESAKISLNLENSPKVNIGSSYKYENGSILQLIYTKNNNSVVVCSLDETREPVADFNNCPRDNIQHFIKEGDKTIHFAIDDKIYSLMVESIKQNGSDNFENEKYQIELRINDDEKVNLSFSEKMSEIHHHNKFSFYVADLYHNEFNKAIDVCLKFNDE
jgi:hypothetical protein